MPPRFKVILIRAKEVVIEGAVRVADKSSSIKKRKGEKEMLWFVIMVLGPIVALVLLIFANSADKSSAARAQAAQGRWRNDDKIEVSGGTLRIISVVVVVLLGIITFFSSVHFVQAGFVDVVYQFGGIVGQRAEGLQVTAPWQDVQSWEVRVQSIQPKSACDTGAKDAKGNVAAPTPQCLEAFSKETQDVFIKPTLNLQVNPGDIQLLARTVGPDYIDRLVLPRLDQIFKDETVKYSSVDIAPHRDDIRVAVRDRLQQELAKWSIQVDDLLINNLDFRQEFKDSIEAKQIATQEALRQKELIAAKEAEAKQKAAEAKGNADKLRIEAKGQADANNLISQSLTPALIEFQAVQKLAPDVKIALIPSGNGVLIDPSTLVGQVPSSASPSGGTNSKP